MAEMQNIKFIILINSMMAVGFWGLGWEREGGGRGRKRKMEGGAKEGGERGRGERMNPKEGDDGQRFYGYKLFQKRDGKKH